MINEDTNMPQEADTTEVTATDHGPRLSMDELRAIFGQPEPEPLVWKTGIITLKSDVMVVIPYTNEKTGKTTIGMVQHAIIARWQNPADAFFPPDELDVLGVPAADHDSGKAVDVFPNPVHIYLNPNNIAGVYVTDELPDIDLAKYREQ